MADGRLFVECGVGVLFGTTGAPAAIGEAHQAENLGSVRGPIDGGRSPSPPCWLNCVHTCHLPQFQTTWYRILAAVQSSVENKNGEGEIKILMGYRLSAKNTTFVKNLGRKLGHFVAWILHSFGCNRVRVRIHHGGYSTVASSRLLEGIACFSLNIQNVLRETFQNSE